MIERRQHLGFALEADKTFGILRERDGRNFDGDIASERGIACPINLPMPPAPSGATISYGPGFVPGARAITSIKLSLAD